jgi:hypothetical protein
MDFKRIIDKAVAVKKGCFSLYIQCNKKVGIKCFENEATRDDAFRKQKKAWEKGLAPNCFAEMEFYEKLDCGTIKTWYCYTTQVVKTFNREKIRRIYWEDKLRSSRDKIERILSLLALRLYEEGFPGAGNDMHRMNIGFIGSKPVAIDFGSIGGDRLCTEYGEKQ